MTTFHCKNGHARTKYRTDPEKFRESRCLTCGEDVIPESVLGQFAHEVEHPPRGASVSFVCSLHGEQDFDHFGFASVVLACGCQWTATTDGLEPREFFGYWRDGDLSTQAMFRTPLHVAPREEANG